MQIKFVFTHHWRTFWSNQVHLCMYCKILKYFQTILRLFQFFNYLITSCSSNKTALLFEEVEITSPSFSISSIISNFIGTFDGDGFGEIVRSVLGIWISLVIDSNTNAGKLNEKKTKKKSIVRNSSIQSLICDVSRLDWDLTLSANAEFIMRKQDSKFKFASSYYNRII